MTILGRKVKGPASESVRSVSCPAFQQPQAPNRITAARCVPELELKNVPHRAMFDFRANESRLASCKTLIVNVFSSWMT